MPEKLLAYATVFITALLKFAVAPPIGFIQKLTWYESAIFTVMGMMTTVLIIQFTGNYLKELLDRQRRQKGKPPRRLFTKRNRRLVRIYQRSGIWGIAFLTPILFSPVVGSIMAVSIGERHPKIFISMLTAAIFWAITLSLFIQFFGEKALQWFGHK